MEQPVVLKFHVVLPGLSRAGRGLSLSFFRTRQCASLELIIPVVCERCRPLSPGLQRRLDRAPAPATFNFLRGNIQAYSMAVFIHLFGQFPELLLSIFSPLDLFPAFLLTTLPRVLGTPAISYFLPGNVYELLRQFGLRTLHAAGPFLFPPSSLFDFPKGELRQV